MKRQICFLITLVYSQISLAQQPTYFRVGEEQFSGIDIYTILQDKEAFIWIGTNDGLYRYDGYDFKKYKHPSMKSQSVFGLKMDNHGVVHCFNLFGQFYQVRNDSLHHFFQIPDSLLNKNIYYEFDGENNFVFSSRGFHHVENDKIYPLTDQRALQLHISKNNSGELYLFEPEERCIYTWKDGKRSEIPVHQLDQSEELSTNSINYNVVGEDEFYFSPGKNRFWRYQEGHWSDTPQLHELPDVIHLVHHTEGGEYWFALSRKGMSAIDRDGNILYNNTVLFPPYQISAMASDREGNLWFGTKGKGIIVVPNPRVIEFNNHPMIREDDLKCITSNGEEVIYVSGFNGLIYEINDLDVSILYESGRKVEFLEYINADESLLFENVRTTILQPKNHLEIYSISSPKDIYPLSNSEYLIASSNGVSFFSFTQSDDTYKNLFESFSQYYTANSNTRFLNGDRSNCVAFNAEQEEIWAGTVLGLQIISKDSSTIITDGGQAINAADIEFYDSLALVATTTDGILIFQEDQLIARVNTQNGLISDQIKKIELKEEQLFVATNSGMQIWDFNTSESTVISKSHGLISNRILDFEMLGDELWFVFAEGLQRINIRELRENSIPPLIRFTKLLNEDEEILKDQRDFEYHQNQLEFEFVANAFKHRGELRYEYQLEGYDDSWQKTSYLKNSVKYNSLPDGHYTFKVKAINESGVASKTIDYSFSIHPPFWETWWFYALCALGIVIIVTAYFVIRIAVIRRRLRLEKQLKNSEVTAIKAQMNPHFVFNALNSVQDLILQKDIRESTTYLGKFSNLMRKTLDYSGRDKITIHEEIELLRLYLDLEKLRFGDDFSAHIHCSLSDQRADEIKIPTMLLQPYVENAIKHGLLHQSGLKELNISFNEVGDRLICTVEDNGIGRDRASAIKKRQEKYHQSFASGAIQKRLDLINTFEEKKIILTITDLFDSGEAAGTRVEISFPIPS